MRGSIISTMNINIININSIISTININIINIININSSSRTWEGVLLVQWILILTVEISFVERKY